ncbi:MAG: extracellular solute-binding protein [Tepidanaerobacter acetatoxydans]|uniref:ABC transporter substrate-binding protein n=1 Tax=Tepidanaerobacter TaxID=499228 RepID=UPI000AA5CA8D|nr:MULTISPECIES: ABC transporter substrate-binding protein [Tepidanaerobacter]NLU10826.1 extracellular solute-binding protein [Tepidanaerobacter acetatoxydans]
MRTTKKIIALLLVVVIAGSVVGCGAGSAQKEPSESESDPGTLVVYTSHKEDVYGPIVKEFQERTGIQVDIVAAGTGEMLSRIETEANNPQGDIMFGGGVESLEAYKEYFEPYISEEAVNIGNAFLTADNKWTGFSALPIVIMYNKKLVSENEVPKSWEDLLDEKWKGQIAYTDPNLSGSCFTALVTMMLAHPENDGWDFVRKLVDNLDGKILNSSSAIFKGVADGEYAVGITLEESAQKYVIAGAEVGYVYPSEGTSIVPDGTAIIKGTKNLENAKKFLDFTVSKDAQNMIVSEMSRRPVRVDVAPGQGLAALDEIPVVDYDVAWAAANKAQILNTWKQIMTGK